MSYIVKPDGSIEVRTLDEAIALAKRLRSDRNGAAPIRPPSDSEYAEKVLAALSEGGARGVKSSTLAEKAKLDTPKALGPVMKGLRNRIISLANGKPVEDFIWKKRGRKDRATTWYVNSDRLREIGMIK